jgi:hypothetical protein
MNANGLRSSLVFVAIRIIVRCSHVPVARPPRRPTGPWLQVTLGVRRLGYLRELSERLQNLVIAERRSRCGFLYFKLGGHSLDLRLLLFETRSEGLYFFLLLCDRSLEILL